MGTETIRYGYGFMAYDKKTAILWASTLIDLKIDFTMLVREHDFLKGHEAYLLMTVADEDTARKLTDEKRFYNEFKI